MTDERIVIHANSNVSRGKFAAAAVHAALTAAGVHPGLPVIVLGAKPSDIEKHTTVIRDAGVTEVEPGTVTSGTDWTPDGVTCCPHSKCPGGGLCCCLTEQTPAQVALIKIRDRATTVIALDAGQQRTHDQDCWIVHRGCLAALVGRIAESALAEEGVQP